MYGVYTVLNIVHLYEIVFGYKIFGCTKKCYYATQGNATLSVNESTR